MQLGRLNYEAGDYAVAERELLAVDRYFQQKPPPRANYTLDLQRFLYELYQDLGRYEAAFFRLKRYEALKDSLNKAQKRELRDELMTRYDVERKEQAINILSKEKALQAEENRMQRVGLWLGGCITALIVLALALIVRQSRERKRHNEALQRQKNLLKATNDALTEKNLSILQQKEEIGAQAEQISAQRDDLDRALRELQDLHQFKDAVTGSLVHDLKNPLNAILAFSQTEDLNHYKEPFEQAARQMLTLTLNMLDVQKFEQAEVRLDLQPARLRNLARAAAAQTAFLAEARGLTVVNDVPAEIVVEADGEMIVRVFVNLLTNAIKFSPPESAIRVSAILGGGFAEIRVSDSGPGIPEDKLEAVFEKFAQAEPVAAGAARSTGLGLAFCKLAVEAHGGTIRAESAPEEGATMVLRLPAKSASSLPEAMTVEPQERARAELVRLDASALGPEIATALREAVNLLERLDVYETSEIDAALDLLEGAGIKALDAWRVRTADAAFAANETRFRELLAEAKAALAAAATNL